MLEQKSLVTSIVEKIEKQILDGDFMPGERVMEQRLCEELGVSRSPVREALRILESQGFIVREDRKGVRVAMATSKEVVDAYTIRANLESLATYLAVKQNTPGLIEKLKKLNHRLEQACAAGNVTDYYRINVQFHETLISACGNEQLIQMLKVFIKQTARYRKEILFSPGKMDKSLKKHVLLIRSLEEGDAQAAEQIRKELILSSIEHLNRKLNNEEVGSEDQLRNMHILP